MPENLPLPAQGLGSAGWWREQMEWSARVRDDKMPGWKRHVEAYLDDKGANRVREGRLDEVRVNIEYEKTEQKRGQLFFRVPEVQLKPLLPGLDQTVRLFQRVLNTTIGGKELDLKSLMQEVLFDVLCPAGIAACKIGYRAYEEGTARIQVGTQPGEPAPGAIFGLSTPEVPLFDEVPNVVAERYFADRISPGKLLLPPDFDRANYDQAPWLGDDFWMDRAEAERLGWITRAEGEALASEPDDHHRLVELAHQGVSRQGQLKGRELWYYAARVDASVAHPDRVRRLVFLEGKADPVLHGESPYQRFEGGRFTGGMKGLPIKILTLRYVSDTPYPPSDCAITRRLGDELSEGRTQMIKQRRRAIPLRVANKGLVDLDDLERMKRGDIGEIIGVDGNIGESIQELARAAYPRENFTFDEICKADVDRAWALGANQSGVREQTTRTATELSLIQKAVDTRLVWEQGLVMDFFLRIVEDVGSLLQLFADETDYVEMLGDQGARQMVPWNKLAIQGRFAYSVKADSAKRPDVNAERELAMARQNLFGNNPYVNQEALTRENLAIFDGDPDALVKQPTPPPPEKPKISVAIKGEDLNPAMPQYGNVVNLLIQAGVPTSMLDRGQPQTGPESTPGQMAMPQAKPAPGGMSPMTSGNGEASGAESADASFGGLAL